MKMQDEGDEIAELLLIPAEPDATLTVQTAIVKGLQPSTTYTIAYAAINSLGYGPYSASCEPVQTLAEGTSSKATNNANTSNGFTPGVVLHVVPPSRQRSGVAITATEGFKGLTKIDEGAVIIEKGINRAAAAREKRAAMVLEQRKLQEEQLKLTEALKVRRASREQQAIEHATATLKRRLSKQQQSGNVETNTNETATDVANE
eukprot:6327-Heterococcus_DN1.PRE.1